MRRSSGAYESASNGDTSGAPSAFICSRTACSVSMAAATSQATKASISSRGGTARGRTSTASVRSFTSISSCCVISGYSKSSGAPSCSSRQAAMPMPQTSSHGSAVSSRSRWCSANSSPYSAIERRRGRSASAQAVQSGR